MPGYGITIEDSKTPLLPSSKEKSSTKPKWMKTAAIVFGLGITIGIFVGMFLIYSQISELDSKMIRNSYEVKVIKNEVEEIKFEVKTEFDFGPYPRSIQDPIALQKGKQYWSAKGPFRKITVGTRMWDSPYNFYPRPTKIVQGLILESVDGTVNSFGVGGDGGFGEELVVPEGQCIKEVILKFGWYIDQIGFVTDKNISLGPVGGRGGHKPGKRIAPKKIDFCLDSIEGVTVETEDAPAVTSLKFIFSHRGHF